MPGSSPRANQQFKGDIPNHVSGCHTWTSEPYNSSMAHGDRVRRDRQMAALRWGITLERILPSRGPYDCCYASTCIVARDPSLRPRCQIGQPCPYEQSAYDELVRSARTTFIAATSWLEEDEYEKAIRRFAMLSLQRRRADARTAAEGLLREVRQPNGGRQLRPGLGVGRYGTTIDRRFQRLMRRLLRKSCDA